MNKIKLKNKLNIIQRKHYNTIELVLAYPFDHKKEDMFDVVMLQNMLIRTSSKYPTEKEFHEKIDDLSIVNIRVNYWKQYNKDFIVFNLILLDPAKAQNIKLYNVEKAIKFYLDAIYKPNVQNNAFNENIYNRYYTFFKEDRIAENNMPRVKASNAFLDVYDNLEYYTENFYHNMDMLDNVNAKTTYDFYKKVILNNKPIVIAFGDIKEDFTKIVNKYFDFDNTITNIDIIRPKPYTPSKKSKTKTIKTDNNESILIIGYKIQDFKPEEEYYLWLLSRLLDYPNKLIFDTLRSEKHLIYSHRYVFNIKYGAIIIELYIENEAKEKAIEALDDIFNDITDVKNIKKGIKKLQKTLESELLDNIDNKDYKFNKFIDKKILFSKTTEELIEYCNNIDIPDFISFIKRVKKDTIYFEEGEVNEKLPNC